MHARAGVSVYGGVAFVWVCVCASAAAWWAGARANGCYNDNAGPLCTCRRPAATLKSRRTPSAGRPHPTDQRRAFGLPSRPNLCSANVVAFPVSARLPRRRACSDCGVRTNKLRPDFGIFFSPYRPGRIVFLSPTNYLDPATIVIHDTQNGKKKDRNTF